MKFLRFFIIGICGIFISCDGMTVPTTRNHSLIVMFLQTEEFPDPPSVFFEDYKNLGLESLQGIHTQSIYSANFKVSPTELINLIAAIKEQPYVEYIG